MYRSVVGSYVRLLPPAVTVSVRSLAGSLELQATGPEDGEPAANIPSPLFPLKLNFTGIARPACTTLNTGRLSTGWKKTAKLYCTITLNSQVPGVVVPSSADACTVVVPSGKTEPEAGLLVTFTLDEQPSVAV